MKFAAAVPKFPRPASIKVAAYYQSIEKEANQLQ
jgi:hypothetical protein